MSYEANSYMFVRNKNLLLRHFNFKLPPLAIINVFGLFSLVNGGLSVHISLLNQTTFSLAKTIVTMDRGLYFILAMEQMFGDIKILMMD